MINMNAPMGPSPLDRPGGLVGQPIDRIEGPLKVTGRAPYAYEYRDVGSAAYGYLVIAGIGSGTLTDIDTAAAEKAPGVLLVVTHKNAPKQATPGKTTKPQLSGTTIDHHGQPVALVVADTFENARAAAYLVKPAYAPKDGRYHLGSSLASAVTPQASQISPDTNKGNVEAAMASAPVKVDVTYTTPAQTHAMMEPHATIASWEGDKLTLHTANQMLPRGVDIISSTLLVPKENVRLISRYVGGGFGAKLEPQADAILAAIAARMLSRPVKLALTRQQIFHVTTHRSDTIQRLRLAANADGSLVGVAHESWSDNTPGQAGFETAAQATRNIYATPNLSTAHRLVTLNLPVSSAMRAPGEAVGLLALESAMDELAVQLNMDPIALRMKNEPTVDPDSGKPFSSRTLTPCLQKGAELFGWEKRNATPGQVHDGRWLVGMGVAAAIRGNPMLPAKAGVTLDRDGVLTVRTSMTDIGTGSYTILAQIAGDLLGLPINKVRVELGDTALPAAPGSGGSFGANSAGSAVYDACMVLRGKLLDQAGMKPDDATFANGFVTANGSTVRIGTLAGQRGLSADGAADPGDSRKAFNQQSYGAHFAEVGVDMDTGEIRLRRMLGVFTAGRILNAKTARSQAIGGMTFGVGAALTEEVVIDARNGLFVNHDLAEYHVPVHADIPAIDAIFLPELDDHSSAMKSKGIGELGICGAGAAVANAVYNASGVRIRDYPLTLDKVLSGWASADRREQRSQHELRPRAG